MIWAWAAVACADSAPPPAPPAAPPPTAAEVLRAARDARASGDLQLALGEAEALSREFPNTPEADTAALLIPAIREQIQAAGEEAAARRLAEKWSYRSDVDPMTSRTSRYASIQSENEVSFGFPYEGAQRATLLIRDHASYGRDVILQIREGQFLCTSYDPCRVRVRFDEGEARTWTAVSPADNSTTSIFLQNYDSFVRQLQASKVVRVQASFYQEGSPVFEFHVGGFDNERYRR